MQARSLLLLPGVLALVLAGEASASAFCRTTTCVCHKKDEPLPEKNGLPQSTCGQPTGECPVDEHNCHETGTPIAWAGGCIGYSPNLAGTTQLTADQFNTAFDTAFQAWALVDCGGGRHPSIQVFTLRPTTCAKSDYNPVGPNVNSLYFTDNGWTDYKTTQELDGVIAKTRVNFDHVTGVLLDADIAFNSARHDFTVTEDGAEYDLISVLTHEAGHFLGLDHSDDPTSIMYWTYNVGSIKRELQADDIAAICTVYPPDRQTTCDPTPKGGLEDSCGPDPKVAGCETAPGSSVPGDANGLVPVAFSFFGLTAIRAKWKRGKGK